MAFCDSDSDSDSGSDSDRDSDSDICRFNTKDVFDKLQLYKIISS